MIGGVDLARVRRHVADAPADAVEQLTHRFVEQVLLMQIGGLHPGALHQAARALVDHALPGAVHAVARRAKRLELLAAAQHGRLRHGHLRREGLGESTVAAPAIEVIVVAQLVHAFNCRSERLSLFQVGLLTNRALLWAVLLSLVMQLAVLSLPAAQPIFKVAPLPIENWELMAAMVVLPLIIVEAAKWIKRR